MELRALLSESQRQLFKASMIEARAAKGARFRENTRSRVSDIQLTFATLYGIFDEESGHPDRLLGGFCLHALDEFGESFTVPELSYELVKYSPHTVFEAGQLWSFHREAALSLRTACMILLALRQAQALLIYPVIIPRHFDVLSSLPPHWTTVYGAFCPNSGGREDLDASYAFGRRRASRSDAISRTTWI